MYVSTSICLDIYIRQLYVMPRHICMNVCLDIYTRQPTMPANQARHTTKCDTTKCYTTKCDTETPQIRVTKRATEMDLIARLMESEKFWIRYGLAS